MNYFLVSKTMYDANTQIEYDTLISVYSSTFTANKAIEKLEKELLDNGFRKIRRARGSILVKDFVQVQFNCVEVPFNI
ncbi:MAG: hypothetical protein K6C34_00835 [Alphaproteobacteria bacterium]|nr:hypothetical protein [Alphaproteobacteria bacterium]